MYAIMGATGKVGGAAARALAAAGHEVGAVTRQPQEAYGGPGRVLQAGPEDEAGLARAFAGAAAVFAMLPPYWDAADHGATTRRAARTVAAALRTAQPGHVVILSSEGAHLPAGTGPVVGLGAFEAEIAATGLPATVLRPSYYLDNWAGVLPVARAAGLLPTGLTADRAIETVFAADVGAIAAGYVAGDPPAAGRRVVAIAGDRPVAPSAIAAALSALLGRPVEIAPQTADEVRGNLLGAGASPSYAAALVELDEAINTGRIGHDAGVGELRRGTTPLARALTLMLGG